MEFEKEYNLEFQDYRDMDIFEEMKEFCAQKLAQQKTMLTAEIEKQTAEDICKLIDGIELNHRNTSLEEWKQYKGIRNAIRDKYVLKKIQDL